MKRQKIKLLLSMALGLALLSGCSEETAPAVSPTALPTTPSPEQLEQGRGQVEISEFMEKNKACLQAPDGSFPDWVELYNPSQQGIDLEGFSLSDKENKRGWVFPSMHLGPGERRVILLSGAEADFALKEGEGLYLRNPWGTLLDQAQCGGTEGDVSMVKGAEGSYAPCLYPSPGWPNDSGGYEQWQQSQEAPGPLVINEVMVFNRQFPSQRGEYADWVELKNLSGEELELGGYSLSDDADDLGKFPLPDISLKSGESLLLYCSEEPVFGQLHSGFELGSENEQLYLSSAGAQILDYASLKDIPYGCSYGRREGEKGWWYFAQPTPLAENGEGFRRVAEAPRSLGADGVFEGVDSLKVELSAPGQIRYTIDGFLPRADSPLYQGPIELDRTAVVRAVNFEEGALPSRPLNLSYIINEGHSLPVASLVTDSPWDFERMYEGRQKGIELPASISFYEEGGSFSLGCGLAMNGQTSLAMPKKNMSLRFRGAYGDSSLDYDIYGGGVSSFTNLLLRSGQDHNNAIIRNELSQELALQATDRIINQRSRYCILYINGQYWGIYTLKEKSNEQLYADIAGLSRDSVTAIEADVPRDSDFFKEVVEFCQFNDMSLEENYRHFCSLVDVDSLIDWVILEGYCANTDLSSGNLRYCRSTQGDGKWRFMFYDLDASFMDQSSVYMNILSQWAREHRQMSSFIVPLMDNQEFCHRFLTRAGELMKGPLTVEKVLELTDRLSAEIAPEVERDYARFGMSVDSWYSGLEQLKATLEIWDWQRLNIDRLCQLFQLDEAQRELYFGEVVADG